MIFLILIYISSLPTPEFIAEPTPTPIPAAGPTKLELEIERLDLIVDMADPVSEPFSPPPVDMEVIF